MATKPNLSRSCQICESIDAWLSDKNATKDVITRLKIKAMMPKLAKFRKYEKFVKECDCENPKKWKRDMSKVTRIVIHYTAEYPLPAGERCADSVFNVHTHKKVHYNGVQYNFLIDTDGMINYTRDLRLAAGANKDSILGITISYQGGLIKGKSKYIHEENGNEYKRDIGYDTRTAAQKESILNLIKVLMAIFPNIKEVVGHRDTNGYEDYTAPESQHERMTKNAYTQCPGFWVKKDPVYSQINAGKYKL